MAAQLLLCALGQTAEPSAYDTAAASAYASCGGFNVTSSPQLTVTQLTPTSATVTSASAGTTFWLADGAGTVLALTAGTATQRTLSWDAHESPLYLVARVGCASTSATGLESAPVPMWGQRFSDVQNAWDSRSSTSATGLAPALNVNYAQKRFRVQATTLLGSAATASVVGEQLVPMVFVRDGLGKLLFLQEFTAADGSSAQPTSSFYSFPPNTTSLSACAIVGNGNQCDEKDLTSDLITEITTGSTVTTQTAVASYVTSSFDAGLSTLTLSPGPACVTSAGYTLFSSPGTLALGTPLALAVNGASTTVSVHACCAALAGTTQLSCSAPLQSLTVDVQSLMNAESLALSNNAAAAADAAAAAALADGSLLCDGTHTVGAVYTRFATGANCTCQCVQYRTDALSNCTLAEPSCFGGRLAATPPAPPASPSSSSMDTGALAAITLSGLFAAGSLCMVFRLHWKQRNTPVVYNMQIGGGAATHGV